ncbi:MAG: hypothetical protein PHV05_02085 [Candidatus Riflebacteria bacterium]|nr:hypothetical protein [Candidatus Riflebacteria bacterium]
MRIRDISGVTLLELMLALLILSSAMIPIASLMGYGGRATSKDARRIVAIQTLEKTLRQLLQEPFDQIPVGNAVKTSFNGVDLGNITSSAGYSYEVELSSKYVSPVDFAFQNVKVNLPTFDPGAPQASDFADKESLSLANCVIELIVKVTWNEQKNLPVEVSAMTYRANFRRRNG